MEDSGDLCAQIGTARVGLILGKATDPDDPVCFECLDAATQMLLAQMSPKMRLDLYGRFPVLWHFDGQTPTDECLGGDHYLLDRHEPSAGQEASNHRLELDNASSNHPVMSRIEPFPRQTSSCGNICFTPDELSSQ